MAKKIGKGIVIEELVKGSLDYTIHMIQEAFRAQFPYVEGGTNYYINEAFADHVIVSTWSGEELRSDEYFYVMYTRQGESIIFAARDAWEIVELTYQPQTTPQMTEMKRRKGLRIEERVMAQIQLEEAEGKRRIKIEGAITAGVVNGNGRRYPAHVIEAAVAELRNHLNESAGQGRAIQLLGEAEHPSDKGGRPNLLETVTKWESVSFNGARVDITGRILETSKGRDILTLMEGGVMPGVSLRGYGDGKKTDGVFEVSELHITGFDLVLEPSFENAAQLIESIQTGETEMNLEELLKLMREHPEAFANITEAQVKKMGDEQLKRLEEGLRTKLGIGADADIAKALDESMDKARKFDASQKRDAIQSAITEATQDLPFGEKLNKLFVESFGGQDFADAAAVKKFAEGKRKEYGALAAAGVLKNMGFDEKRGVVVIGDVIETETGTPEFGRAAFELTESVRKSEMRAKRKVLERAESPAAVYTGLVLQRFDKMYRHHLLNEARMFNEAETTSDLNLPYSVSRAIIEEAFPDLIAANVFDFGLMDNSPDRLYFETFSGETGYSGTVTGEVVTGGAEGTWYDLAYKRVTPGSVSVTSNPAGTTYAEGTDFVIDYPNGKILFLDAGSIGANDVLVDYTYTAIRKGENTEIERAKVTLSYVTIEAAADRLADYITREAIVFSRSQLGWDAVARTMANLIRQTRRKIDQGILYKALTSVLSVASNSGGTHDISADDIGLMASKLGSAKVLVANRFWEPTGIVMSMTNADLLSNWSTGFTRTGFPNAFLNAAGFAGGVKGLPIFATPEFSESYALVVNRQLVAHRVYQPMQVRGPFPTYSNGKLVAAEQYYTEEFNATESPVANKGAYIKIQA